MTETDYTQYKFGLIESPPDPRDYTLDKIISVKAVKLPDEFMLPYNHNILDQNIINSCIGHSLTYAREITQEIQNGIYTKFSPGFVYGNRKDSDYQGEGWNFREALDQLLKVGICNFETFPYNEEMPGIRNKILSNKEELYNNAYSNRISAYARISPDLNEIKTAIYLLKSPVVFAMKICPSFYNISNYNPEFNPPKESEKLYGLHALAILGWQKRNGKEVLIIINSWGENWADHGLFYIPTDVFESQPQYYAEFWSITDEIVPGGEKMELRTTSYKYIDIHHTAGNEKNTEQVRQEHLAQGWGDIGYNSVIEKDGTVGKGRNPKYKGAHNIGLAPDSSGLSMNEVAYSICHIGNFEEEFMNDTQLNSSVKHCVDICRKYNIIPSRNTIRMHKDDFPTACPGRYFPYDKYLNEVIKLYNQGDDLHMKKAVLLNTPSPKDLVLVAEYFAYTSPCPVLFRVNGQPPEEAFKADELIILGGEDVPNHPNRKLFSGDNWFRTVEKVAQSLGKN